MLSGLNRGLSTSKENRNLQTTFAMNIFTRWYSNFSNNPNLLWMKILFSYIRVCSNIFTVSMAVIISFRLNNISASDPVPTAQASRMAVLAPPTRHPSKLSVWPRWTLTPIDLSLVQLVVLPRPNNLRPSSFCNLWCLPTICLWPSALRNSVVSRSSVKWRSNKLMVLSDSRTIPTSAISIQSSSVLFRLSSFVTMICTRIIRNWRI